METELCPYCHTDRDGFSQYIPRVGTGNAFIYKHASIFGGWLLHIHWPRRAEMKIQIKFCPMCGRELKDGV
jgi:hypothetical protein